MTLCQSHIGISNDLGENAPAVLKILWIRWLDKKDSEKWNRKMTRPVNDGEPSGSSRPSRPSCCSHFVFGV
jgi:hypothetical protein